MAALSPTDIIKETLKCKRETAEAVRKNIAGLMVHRETRAFITMHWHLSNTTRPSDGNPVDMHINEGKRSAALFIVACAEAGLDLEAFSKPKQKEDE